MLEKERLRLPMRSRGKDVRKMKVRAARKVPASEWRREFRALPVVGDAGILNSVTEAGFGFHNGWRGAAEFFRLRCWRRRFVGALACLRGGQCGVARG